MTALSKASVEPHVGRIRRKLDASSRAHAVVKALALGLI